jgi:hypothetical protein
MKIVSQSRAEHRRMLVKRWYSLSGVETVRKTICNDETLDGGTRDELLRIADRRIDEIVDARLGISPNRPTEY